MVRNVISFSLLSLNEVIVRTIDNVHVAHSMLWMKALTQNGILFRSQVYPDENHGLVNVARHLYQTMEEFLTDCFALRDRFDEVGLRKARLSPLITD